MSSVHIIIVYKCTFVHIEPDSIITLSTCIKQHRYKLPVLLSASNISLHGVRIKRQEVSHKAKKKCKTTVGLFDVLSEKFKLQHNQTILSLKYWKLIREQSKNADEWVGYLRMKANEYEYKEKDRRLKEQFINGIKDDKLMTEIIWVNAHWWFHLFS